jgi:hypothetical protein
MLSHRQIIELWPSRADFARELDVSYQTARQWYARDGIPVRYWQAVVLAAKSRGLAQISLEVLVASKADLRSPAEENASESAADAHQEDDARLDDDADGSQGLLKLQAAE